MIKNYTSYIERFLLNNGLNGARTPGEHHFVASYLVPRLFQLNGLVPDYINPDGTKGISGDIVYFENGNHHLGIEVKFETIRLTKTEFNCWIVDNDTFVDPDVFIGIGTAGIIVLPWNTFRIAYLNSVNLETPTKISKDYGPQKSINVLFRAGQGDGYLPIGTTDEEAQSNEAKFLLSLRGALNH